MENIETVLKQIPQVERLLQETEISAFIPVLGRGIVINSIREEIRLFREHFVKDEELDIRKLHDSIIDHLRRKKLEKLQRVINATGVIIHTNLGRSPISANLLKGLADTMSAYCNLELYLPTGTRGKRGGFAEELISNLTSAEDAIIVNNNASSVFLILNEFGMGKDVVISRGELVQIGGGFRIPDIMRQTGANLVEVGTTNITDIEDYRKAITENTGIVLSVHQSNFRIEGFSKAPSLRDLASLKSQSVLFVRDLGSGNLVVDGRFPKSFEPTVSHELSQGADIICFSGDKLLGGCQAGIIAGRRDLISRLRKNPLMRMLRVDKFTYYLLQETLIAYANRELEKISLWNVIFQNKKVIANKINRLMKRVTAENKKEIVKRIPVRSLFGGGSLPTLKIESAGIHIDMPGMKGEDIYKHFISRDVPIAGYILEDRFIMDLRTVFDDDIPAIAAAIDSLIK
ncbi:MAG: L-seryl-tRNA(Sec) selenium transferase [Spirochaetes bacterium]|nr:L-seryl-tRNA(Sec) selenium transferase [Spirochaetota bacterium]